MGAPDCRPIFDEFLARLRAGEGVSLAALAAEHPEHAGELRARWDEYRKTQGAQEPFPGASFFRRGKPLASPALGVTAGQMLGDFRLVEPIGQGGMGQVWMAEQASLGGRQVAIKLMRPDRVSARTAELFGREARAGGRLHHPGIVALLAHGESEGVAWIAMEYVEGSWTLRDFLDEAAKRDEQPATYYQRVAVFAARLADALQAAHAAGVIHRDLKPQNVLVTRQDEPKVTDFGLARITDESALSVTGDFAGTYFYMSPEQAAGKRLGLDHRTDIFSLGVMLYEMLALRRPFEGDTAHQVAYQILLKDPPDLRSFRSRIPGDLAVICGKCLEKDRDRRYATMAEVAADIRRHLESQPIVARPPGRLRKLELWARRNPTKSVGGALLVAAFAAVSLLLAQNVRANRELERANEELDRKNEDLVRTVGERNVAIESLAHQTQAAEASAAAEKARADEVLRLSALRDYDELIAQADELWPPHPANIAAYQAWIRTAVDLAADLPLHRAKLQELRLSALPRGEEQRDAERRAHPDFPHLERLSGEIAARRATLLQRRDGVAAELPELDWEALPADARALNALAWPLVDPERETFGGEARGLVLARRALERALSGSNPSLVPAIGDTVSRAYFALGRDEDALQASREAVESAPAGERAAYEGYLADLERWVEAARGEDGLRAVEAALARLEAERAELDARLDERRAWEFPATDEGRAARWWHASLSSLIDSLEGLQDEASGLLSSRADAASPSHGWSIPRRLAFAQQLRDASSAGGDWDRRWRRAIAAIRDDPRYGGLELGWQVGLVPIGPDPESGLWEFWHVATGAEPLRGERGRLLPTEETGLALVLIPGGKFWMGAQSTNARARNYDPQAEKNEEPVHQVALSPYFLSKYEMTQGQWLRFAGRNPSRLAPSADARAVPIDLLHPVESVSWLDCRAELSRMGLSLPSEAQWENGCRGGTDTPWWTGSERESLRERNAVNLADQSAARAGVARSAINEWPELDDGYSAHAPVGTYAANPFGLHEVYGNVWEWCLDAFEVGFYAKSPRQDPVAAWDGSATCMLRGGCYRVTAALARSSVRNNETPSSSGTITGVRPARIVE